MEKIGGIFRMDFIKELNKLKMQKNNLELF